MAEAPLHAFCSPVQRRGWLFPREERVRPVVAFCLHCHLLLCGSFSYSIFCKNKKQTDQTKPKQHMRLAFSAQNKNKKENLEPHTACVLEAECGLGKF